jgi:hypothetical protein
MVVTASAALPPSCSTRAQGFVGHRHAIAMDGRDFIARGGHIFAAAKPQRRTHIVAYRTHGAAPAQDDQGHGK